MKSEPSGLRKSPSGSARRIRWTTSYREDTGSFRHNHTLGQESQSEVGGKGRVAYKASVPQGLHEELLSLVMQQLE